jgi:phosphate-selective porin
MADSLPLIRLGGFFQLDDGLFSQPQASRQRIGNALDAVSFRRARLQAFGKLTDFTNDSIMFDFAQAGRPSFMDVWGEQEQVPFFGSGRKGRIRGWGAWELAGRWSYVDLSGVNVRPQNQLSNTAGPPPSPNAATVNQTTVGVNWYWNKFAKVQFNGIRSMPDYVGSGAAPFDIYGTRPTEAHTERRLAAVARQTVARATRHGSGVTSPERRS